MVSSVYQPKTEDQIFSNFLKVGIDIFINAFDVTNDCSVHNTDSLSEN